MTVETEPIVTGHVPATGIYKDVPLQTYIKWQAVSSTFLKAMRRSPAHARYERSTTRWTPSLQMGDATHLRILQPDLFRERYVQASRCESMKIDGKSQCSRVANVIRDGLHVCTQHLGNKLPDVGAPTLISENDREAVEFMYQAATDHPSARALLLEVGDVELSIVWNDKATGLLCKARIDKHNAANQAITDIKTTCDAGPDRFSKSIYDYGYDIQAAHYLDGCEAVGIDASAFGIIAIESDAPHCVAVYELEPEAVALGWKQREKLIATCAKCMKENEWPGYSSEINRIGVPAWAANKIGGSL